MLYVHLKFLRDHVLHQADSQGGPVIDLGQTCLNKLDAGTDEKDHLGESRRTELLHSQS